MVKLAMLSGCSYRWGQGNGSNARRNCGWRAPTMLIALRKMAHQLGRGTHACRAARSAARLKGRSTVAAGTLPQKCWRSPTSLRSGESGRFRPVCLDILSSFSTGGEVPKPGRRKVESTLRGTYLQVKIRGRQVPPEKGTA